MNDHYGIAKKIERLNNSIQLASSMNKEHLEDAFVSALLKHKIINETDGILGPIDNVILAFENDMKLSFEEFKKKETIERKKKIITFWIQVFFACFGLGCVVAGNFLLIENAFDEYAKLQTYKYTNFTSLSKLEQGGAAFFIFPLFFWFISGFFTKIYLNGFKEVKFKSIIRLSGYFVVISLYSFFWTMLQMLFKSSLESKLLQGLNQLLFFVIFFIENVSLVLVPTIIIYIANTFNKKQGKDLS